MNTHIQRSPLRHVQSALSLWGREPLSRDRIPSRRAVQGASANIAYAPHTHLLEPLTVQRASVRLPPALAWLILVTALAAACPRRASRRAPSVWLQRQCGTRPHTRAHTLAGAASAKGRLCGKVSPKNFDVHIVQAVNNSGNTS